MRPCTQLQHQTPFKNNEKKREDERTDASCIMFITYYSRSPTGWPPSACQRIPRTPTGCFQMHRPTLKRHVKHASLCLKCQPGLSWHTIFSQSKSKSLVTHNAADNVGKHCIHCWCEFDLANSSNTPFSDSPIQSIQ